MTRKLRFALTAVLLVALVGCGAGVAAANTSDSCNNDNVDSTIVVNDNDVVETGDTLNGLNTNVLGLQTRMVPLMSSDWP